MTTPDPQDDSPRRRLLGIAFWAAMAFGLICILAGLAVDRYGPKLFPTHSTRAPQRAAAPVTSVRAKSLPT